MAADDPLCREPLVSVEFEVFGKVQGVYFPKYVRDICLQLGICGWVKNSKTGTILGKMQGPRALVHQIVVQWSGPLEERDVMSAHFRVKCIVDFVLLSRDKWSIDYKETLLRDIFAAQWLTSVGSPGSEIHHCEFTNWENVTKQQYQGFAIRF